MHYDIDKFLGKKPKEKQKDEVRKPEPKGENITK